jgi:hypothetical protein
MVRSDVSADLAMEHGLPGLLGVRRDRNRVFVVLDLPKRADHISKNLIPGVEALAFGYLMRLRARSKAQHVSDQVAVTDDYLACCLHKDDLDHFLVSLAALLSGGAVLAEQPSELRHDEPR